MTMIRLLLINLLWVVPPYAHAGEADELQRLFLKAFAKKQTAKPPQLQVDLAIDGQPSNTISVLLNQEQAYDRLKTDELLPRLKPLLKNSVYQSLLATMAKEKSVSFEWLKKEGIIASYDPATLSVELIINPTLREPLILSLLQDLSSAVRKDNQIKPSRFSGYLNLYTNAALTSAEGKTSHNLQVRMEGSATLGGLNLQSKLTKNDKQWLTSETYLSYDKPEQLRRYRAGEIKTGARNFQPVLTLQGVSLSKEFKMSSNNSHILRGSESLILTTPSEVIVSLNETPIRRYSLAAGTYRLEDIGLREGQNDIEIKVIDTFGKETITTSSQLFDSRLLKPSISKYSFSVGWHDLSNQLTTSGFYQYGLNDTLTVSGDVQVIGTRYLMGADFLKVTEMGSLLGGVAMSQSFSTENLGAAASLEFKAAKPSYINGLRWRVGANYRSRQFSPSWEEPNDQTAQSQYGLQLSMNKKLPGQWHSSLNLNYQHNSQSDDPLFFSLNAKRRVGQHLSISAGANYNEAEDWSVNANVTLLLADKAQRQKRLSLTANSFDSRIESRLEVPPKGAMGHASWSGRSILRASKHSHEERIESAVRFPVFESRMSASHAEQEGVEHNRLQVGINTVVV